MEWQGVLRSCSAQLAHANLSAAHDLAREAGMPAGAQKLWPCSHQAQLLGSVASMKESAKPWGSGLTVCIPPSL